MRGINFMINWKKTVTVVLLFILLGVLGFFGFKLYKINDISATYSSADKSRMNITPKQLKITPVKFENGKFTEVKQGLVKIKYPWPDGKNSSASTLSTKTEFTGGKSAVLTELGDITPFEDFKQTFEYASKNTQDSTKTLSPRELSDLRKLVGSDTISSYRFLEKIYSYTPSQLKLSSSLGSISNCALALKAKNLYLPEKANAIYFFDTGKITGLITVIKSEKKTLTKIDFYMDDGNHYSTIIPNATTEDVNAIISSIEVIK